MAIIFLDFAFVDLDCFGGVLGAGKAKEHLMCFFQVILIFVLNMDLGNFNLLLDNLNFRIGP